MGRHIRLSDTGAFDELVSGEASSAHDCGSASTRSNAFSSHRLEGANVRDVVATAIREIEREHGCLQVADIAARSGVSPRHLNRLMRVWVGYSPKRLASVIRFQETLTQMEHLPSRSVAILAAETGYFDQAHLSLDVTRFAGATPR